MSTITFEIRPEKESQLIALATKNGKDVGALLNDVVDALLNGLEGSTTPRDKSFDAILSPFRRGFAESGMTEEELSSFLDNELKAVRTERRLRRVANG